MKSKLQLAFVTLFIFFALAPISIAQFTPINTARGYPEWAVSVGDILAYEIPFPYVTMTPAGDFDVSIIEIPWVILGAGGVILVTIVFTVASVFPFFKGFERAKLVFSIAFVILLFFGTRTVPMIMHFANAIGFSWFIIGMIVVFVLFWFVLYKIFSHPLIKQGAKSSKAISDWTSRWISGFENFNKYDGISRQKEIKGSGELNSSYEADRKVDQEESNIINYLIETLNDIKEKISRGENTAEVNNLLRQFYSNLDLLKEKYKEEADLDKVQEKLIEKLKEANRGQIQRNNVIQGIANQLDEIDISKYPELKDEIKVLYEKINEFRGKEKDRDYHNQKQLDMLESQLKEERVGEVPPSSFESRINQIKKLIENFTENAAKTSVKEAFRVFYPNVSSILSRLKEDEERDIMLTKRMEQRTQQFIEEVQREKTIDTASDERAKEILALFNEIMKKIKNR